MSTVAAATAASNAAPLNGRVSVVAVVLVAGVVVDVEVVVEVVEVEVLLDVVVDVAGAAVVSGVVALLVEVSTVESGGVVTAVAAVSWQALDADAKATTATPAAPITQKRLAIPPFSPLRTPDRRHRSVGYEAPSRR
jgi:hypothetical protein